MSGVRRALAFAVAERYAGMAISFVSVAAVSRLLTPTEIGISALGLALVGVPNGLREFAACNFLIQGHEITRDDVRTAFTVQFGLTLAICVGLVLLAPIFADFYDQPMLDRFVCVVAAALMIDAVAAPIMSLLRRDLAFGSLAIISLATLSTHAVVVIVLSASGFSFMSFAWAWLASILATLALCLWYRRDVSIFRPTLGRWRRALVFGGYNGAITVLNKVYESIPQLFLGRVMPLDMLGLYNRTVIISGIADRFILAGVFNIAFPALAQEFRAGRSLKEPLLNAFSYITAFYWPALAMMALLAYPIVDLILGDQWMAVAPLLQIVAVASLAWFPVVLMQPLLMAIDAMRHAFLVSLIGLPTSALVLCAASPFGVTAMVASQLFTVPFQVYVGLTYIRRHVPFGWLEVAGALRGSAILTGCSVLPVLLILAPSGFDMDISFGLAAVAAGLAALAWLVGLRLTNHPINAELRRAMAAFQHTLAGRTVMRLLPIGAP